MTAIALNTLSDDVQEKLRIGARRGKQFPFLDRPVAGNDPSDPEEQSRIRQ